MLLYCSITMEHLAVDIFVYYLLLLFICKGIYNKDFSISEWTVKKLLYCSLPIKYPALDFYIY